MQRTIKWNDDGEEENNEKTQRYYKMNTYMYTNFKQYPMNFPQSLNALSLFISICLHCASAAPRTLV